MILVSEPGGGDEADPKSLDRCTKCGYERDSACVIVWKVSERALEMEDLDDLKMRVRREQGKGVV